VSSAEALPSPPEHSPVPQYPIESVDNALRLLWLIGERPSLRLTDASQYLGVASSTAHRLLAMLQYRGFVQQNPASRAYEAGPALDRIAFSVLRRLDVRERARPVLERLAAEVGETVHLGRLEGRHVHFLDSIESTRAVRVGSRLGRSMPAHCTSTGKAMLALLAAEQLAAVYPDEELEQLTPHSVGSRTALVRALDEVRRRGHASSREESEEGVTSLAVALAPGVGAPMALNVSAPTGRMTAAARRAIVERLHAAAEEIDALMR
jgi:DNA-binding IclR family transcriptional regulator